MADYNKTYFVGWAKHSVPINRLKPMGTALETVKVIKIRVEL